MQYYINWIINHCGTFVLSNARLQQEEHSYFYAVSFIEGVLLQYVCASCYAQFYTIMLHAN